MTTSFMMLSEQLCLHVKEIEGLLMVRIQLIIIQIIHDYLSGVCFVVAMGNRIEERFVYD